MNVNLRMFAFYILEMQTWHFTEKYLHAGVALSPALPRYLSSVVKPEPRLLCIRPSASLQLKCVQTSLDSGPVLSHCFSFDIYRLYMNIENKVQIHNYVFSLKTFCHQRLPRPLSNNWMTLSLQPAIFLIFFRKVIHYFNCT